MWCILVRKHTNVDYRLLFSLDFEFWKIQFDDIRSTKVLRREFMVPACRIGLAAAGAQHAELSRELTRGGQQLAWQSARRRIADLICFHSAIDEYQANRHSFLYIRRIIQTYGPIGFPLVIESSEILLACDVLLVGVINSMGESAIKRHAKSWQSVSGMSSVN